MSVSANFNIEKLNENNYNNWKVLMKSILIQTELWAVVSGKLVKTEKNAEEFDNKDEKALASILLCVKTNQLNNIKNCKTSTEAWMKLKEIHQPQGPATKATLTMKLLNLKMLEGTNVRDHLNKFQNIEEQISEINYVIEEDMKSVLLMNSLTKPFEGFVIAMQSRDILPSLSMLKIKILEEAERQAGGSEYQAHEAQVLTSQKFKGSQQVPERKSNLRPNDQNKRCYNCGQKGHFIAQCRKNKESKKYNNHVALLMKENHLTNVNTNQKGTFQNNFWCIDSGATSHLCHNKDQFVIYFEKVEKIQLAGDKFLIAEGYGEVQVKFGKINFLLKDVLYVPALKYNFISVSKVIERGIKCIFEYNYVKMVKNNNVILKAYQHNGLFIANGHYEQCFSVTKTIENESIKWHKRYGHINFDDLKNMCAKGIVIGMKKIQKPTEKCITCAKSKICVKKFPKTSINRSNEVLDLVHSDICGPMSKKSFGGKQYFATFIDDKSRYIFIYFLKTRDEIFEAFKEFKTFAERQTGKKLKHFRSDNGREYVSKKFDDFLKTNGIKRQLTVPYTPQQNGVAERANRTLVEMARSLLIQAKLSESFWADAIHTAVYLRNRAITSALDNITPFEAWTGRKPIISHLRVFGSKVISLNKKNKRKFQDRGEEQILVGYSDTAKAYRLYNKYNKKFSESRDVIFIESDQVEEINNQGEDLIHVEITNENRQQQPQQDLVKEFVQEKEEEEEFQNAVEEFVQEQEEEEEFQNAIEDLQNDEIEDYHPDEHLENQTSEENNLEEQVNRKRGPGRPRIIRGGKPGRPRKEYNMVNQIQQIETPRTVKQALNGLNKDKWKESMQKEYDALIENKTWTLVDLPKNKKAIGCRWVYAIKKNKDGSINKFKSRLVAKGCSQKYGVDYKETFSPVVRYSTIRMLLALACEYNLYLHQLDVTTAYLNGNLQEDVYMLQPDGFVNEKYPNKVLKLQKSLYGLKQSGREWNIKLDEELRNIGFKACPSEPCVYTKNKNGKMNIIIVYVDDIIIACSNKEDVIDIKSQIASKFKIVDGGQISHFLGMEIDREGETGSINLSQIQYIKNLLKEYDMEECKGMETPLEAKFQVDCRNENCEKVDPTYYQSAIGALMYLAITTRPDILHSVSKLSQRNTNPHKEHLIGIKRILRYLKETINLRIHYKKTGQQINCFADADWAGDASDRKSYSGYVFMAAGAAVSWEAKKQNVVALSSTEAEYIALSLAAKEAVFLSKLLVELGFKMDTPMILNGDNQSAQHLVKNPKFHPRSKHIDIKYHYIREIYNKRIIQLNYISTKNMTADILTKNLHKIKHNKFTRDMGIYI